MRKDLEQAWKQAEKTGKPVDIGNIVVCDGCSEDYTDSDEVGGIYFCGKAYCPKCSGRVMDDAERFNETRYITGRAMPGESFRAFVLRLRGGDNTIQVISR